MSEQKNEVILIGRERDEIDDAAEDLLGGFILEMGQLDTETLVAIAERREQINPDGWMQKAIRGYLEVWR